MRAVALLSFWKTRNSIKTIFTDPRKFVPLIIAVLYFGLVFVGTSLSGAPSAIAQTGIDAGLFESGIFLALLLIAICVIDNALGDNLLAFPAADVDYIFPSPISRRVVLLYRLPALTFGACFFAGMFLFIFRFLMRIFRPDVTTVGHESTSRAVAIVATVLCVGIYMNLAMFIAIRFKRRNLIHKVLMAFFLLLVGGIGLMAWSRGAGAVASIAASPWLRWPFLPSHLVTQVLFLRIEQRSTTTPFLSLLGLYGLSLVPMFASNSNFYEESIASSERVWAFRRAAKGGYASLMAAKAEKSRFQGSRDYTISPFGEGAMALLWAHLCASWKRPFATYFTPILAGIVYGVFSGLLNRSQAGVGVGVLAALIAYSSFGFMASARTASEAAIRRRELTATLPIPGWQAVGANLGVPLIALVLFCLTLGTTYAIFQSDYWPMVVVAVLFVFAPRQFARMLINYMLALAYPDFADKLQQFLGQMIYYIFGAPILIFEVALCVPALLLRSPWLAIGTLIVFEFALCATLIVLAGKVSERSIATGEPVRFWRMRSKPIADPVP